MKDLKTYSDKSELCRKYNELLLNWQRLLAREAELERTVEQYGRQLDDQNEMIADLIKQLQQRKDLSQVVENRKAST